ncbi:helix-turn-helix domain-containing protein [Leptospira ryugenii]|nr:helix-turn-helix domain-containing protein [Leptospira ryugenii]
MLEFLGSWLLFGAWFHLLLALHLYTKHGKSKGFPFASISAIAASILIVYAYLVFKKLSLGNAFLNHGYLFAIFLIPASMQYTIEQFLSNEFVDFKKWYRFLPFFLSLIVFLGLQTIDPNIGSSPLHTNFNNGFLSLPEYFATLGCLYWIFTFLKMIHSYRKILFHNPNPAAAMGVRILSMIINGNIVFAVLILVSILFRWTEGLYSAAFLATLMAVIAFLRSQAQPNLFSEILPGLRQSYQTSRILNLDLDELHTKIQRLMVEEKVYQEENLNLANFAERLRIKDYQLSEYINAYLGMNFNRFLNEYRIEEVCKKIEEQPKVNLLHLAYQVGFNSKANFNIAFKSVKKMTPSEYAKGIKKPLTSVKVAKRK